MLIPTVLASFKLHLKGTLYGANTLVGLVLSAPIGSYRRLVWFFRIKHEKEDRSDSSTQKLAEPIHPEIQSIRETQEPNGNCHGWVESAPRNISDSNGLSEYDESNSEPIKRIAGSGRGRRYIQNRVDQGESTQTFGQHYLSCCYSRRCRRGTMTQEKDDGY
jgi:hypothetical protein